MRRRTVLASAAAATTAGCLSRLPARAVNDDTPGASHDDDRGDCPSFVERADRTVCYATRGSADVFLEPSTTRFEESGDDDEVETVTFSLHNGSDAPISHNPNDWAVERRTDDGWTHVAPQEYVEPAYEVPPGGTYRWILATRPIPSPMSEYSSSVVVDLASGETYAFRVHGALQGDDGKRVECVARFEYVSTAPGD